MEIQTGPGLKGISLPLESLNIVLETRVALDQVASTATPSWKTRAFPEPITSYNMCFSRSGTKVSLANWTTTFL